MYKLVIILFVWVGFNSFGQVPNQIGARSNGMANSALMLKDVWGIKNNLGAFGSLEQTSIGVAYQNRFLLNEFANQSVAFNYSTLSAGNFGFYFQQTGFSLYRQSVGGLLVILGFIFSKQGLVYIDNLLEVWPMA